MIDLDDLRHYRIDLSGMLTHLHRFPEQFQQAWQSALAFNLPGEYRRIKKVIILGMGGSAIGGDFARRLALAESLVPVWVRRGYDLPPFVDRETLVIASSYSGNTEETISAFTQALKAGAKALVFTTGGRLREMAEGNSVPVFVIGYSSPPRAAFPSSFVPLVVILQKLGLLSDKATDLQEALAVLNQLAGELAETAPRAANPAKQLAVRLWRHAVIVYGSEMLSEVARRWKTQLNENSKTLAFFELIPELNHNAVLGYEFPPGVKEKIFVVLLHSDRFHPRNRLRYEVTARLLDKAGIKHELVPAVGKSVLAQMMGTVLLGDYVSFYLAMLNRTDPTPIDAIDFIKQYLGQF